MAIDVKKLAWKLDNLFMLRRTLLTKTTAVTGLYVGQLPVLAYICNNEGCTQKEIADWLKVSPASIALSTKRLQKAGFIQKTVDKENLRRNMLSVTPKGSEVALHGRESFNSFDEKMFSCLTQEESDAFLNILDKLINNLAGGEEVAIDFVPMMEMDDRIQERLECGEMRKSEKDK